LVENNLSSEAAKEVAKAWEKMNKVFGLVIPDEVKIPKKVMALAEDRKSARNCKDFKKSDELRDQIEKLGFIIDDLQDNNYLVRSARNNPSEG
jgi:cysteinyl-tRNA synthetase